MFLDKLFDLWSDRCSIKAYHEQLALHSTLLASVIPGCSWRRPTIALHQSNVSRIRGHIASSSVGEIECFAYLSRLSQTGSTFSLFAMMTMPGASVDEPAMNPEARMWPVKAW